MSAPSESTSRPARRARVLLVEDSPTQALAIRGILEHHGFEVCRAENGAEGLHMVACEQPDVVVSDLVMPELDGYQVCRMLKHDALTRHLPVVLLTAREDRLDRFWASEAGADRFVCKSRLHQELIPALEDVLRDAPRPEPVVGGESTLAGSNAGGGVKSRVAQLLDGLLLESTLVARLRSIGVESTTPTQAAHAVLELLDRLLDLEIAVLRLRRHRGDFDYVLAQDARDPRIDQLEDGIPRERVVVGRPSSDLRSADDDSGHRLRLDLEYRGDVLGHLALLLPRHPGRSTMQMVARIGEELPTILGAVLQAEKLEALHAEIERAHTATERMLSSLSSVFVGVDASGVVTRWNDAAAEILGVPAADAVGRPFAACGIRWVGADVPERILEAAASGACTRLENLACLDPAGRERRLELTVDPVEGDGFVLLGADVTEELRMREHLLRVEKLRGIGQLAGGVAHEINTPIQYLVDNLTFLEEAWDELRPAFETLAGMATRRDRRPIAELVEDLSRAASAADLDYLRAEVPSALTQAREGALRIAEVVSAMRDFCHSEPANRSHTDVNRAVLAAVTISRSRWEPHADLVTDLADELPPVPCDAREINQALLALLLNAAEAVERARAGDSRTKGRIEVRTRRVDQEVEISVHDDGCGIDEAIADRVFEPFFTTKDEVTGSGQGLTLAHACIVERHRGRMWFESRPGATTFRVRLPFSPAPDAPEHARRPAEPAARPG